MTLSFDFEKSRTPDGVQKEAEDFCEGESDKKTLYQGQRVTVCKVLCFMMLIVWKLDYMWRAQFIVYHIKC